MSTEELEKYVAKIIKDAKDASGMSIGKIAEEMRKDDKTVSNWVKGKVSPTLPNLIKLFSVMQQPLARAIMPAIYPHLDRVQDRDTIENKKVELLSYIANIASDTEVEKLHFLTFGAHGSSWYPQLEEFVALDHLPMKERVIIAQTIQHAYNIAKARGELVANDSIMPDMDIFLDAIEKGHLATTSGRNAYNVSQK